MNIEEKKIYIYNNIEKIKDPQIILNYIVNNNINYSKNRNGIFLNLNCINDDNIDEFYKYILLSQENEIKEEKYSELMNNLSSQILINKKNNFEKDTNYIKIKLSKIQKEILNTLN